jgi:hypothetical protein
MPRVLPSQVVAVINQSFPGTETKPDFLIYSASSGVLSAIVRLTEEIPTELLTIAAEDYSDLVCALEGLTSAVVRWHQCGGDDPPARIKSKSPVAIIREVLSKCPDQSPSPSTADLAFITDAALRESIRLDISAANRDMENSEWKGATVLAGSATEALLLWAIQEAENATRGTIASAAGALVTARTLAQRPKASLEQWDFIELIEVARHLAVIENETAIQCRLCKNFRNLIHPGRAVRLGQTCDRGATLSALAAVELVIRDLSP